jgi:hypothetical protein
MQINSSNALWLNSKTTSLCAARWRGLCSLLGPWATLLGASSTLSGLATRQNLCNIFFDDIGNAINEILEAGGVFNEEGHSCLRRRVLRLCPAW